MKGYVNVTINEKAHNALVTLMKEANEFMENYDIKNYSTKKYTYHLLRKPTLKTIVLPISSVVVPKGVYCIGYEYDGLARYHEFKLDHIGKAAHQILELFKQNDIIMLDGELVEVYNSFTN